MLLFYIIFIYPLNFKKNFLFSAFWSCGRRHGAVEYHHTRSTLKAKLWELAEQRKTSISAMVEEVLNKLVE